MKSLLLFITSFLLVIYNSKFCHSKDVWVEAEGEAAIAGITAEQARLLALQRARAAAIEKAAGVRVSSITLVTDARLSGEFIKAFSRGYITKEKCTWDKSIYQESPDKPAVFAYKVKLRAKVTIVEKDTKPSFLLEAKLNKSVFKSGEKVEIFLKPSEDAYVAIFNWRADDKIALLFPNQYCTNNFIPEGVWFTFPPRDSGLVLRVKTLPGHKQDTEAIYVVAFNKNIGNSICFLDLFPSNLPLKVASFFSKYIQLPVEKAIEKILVYQVKQK